MALLRVAPKNNGKTKTGRQLLLILDTLKHILFVAKITGLFYVSINTSTRKLDCSDKKKSLIYSLTFFATYLVACLAGFRAAKRSNEFQTLYDLVKKAFNIFCTFSILLQLLLGYFVKFHVAHWLNSLAAFDRDVEKAGIKTDCRRLRRTFNAFLVVGMCVFGLKMVLFQMAFQTPWPVSFPVMFYYAFKNSFRLVFVAFMMHLYLRFSDINESVDKFGLGFVELATDTPLRLNGICRYHYRLSYLARRINWVLSFQLFCSFTVSIGTMLFFSYNLYYITRNISYEVTANRYFSDAINLIFGIIVIIDEIIECFLITNSCRLVIYAANETPKHLHELRNRLLNTEEWDEHIRANSIQFLHQKGAFTAMDYFNIDFSIFNSIGSNVITYLVLFIQLDRASTGANISTSMPIINGSNTEHLPASTWSTSHFLMPRFESSLKQEPRK